MPFRRPAFFLPIALMTSLAPTFAAAQQDISADLAMLKAEFASASAKSLPESWTGGLSGLSLVFTLHSPLPAELDELADEHRSAARSICHKVGVAAVKGNRTKPGLGALRFFVVELKTREPIVGPLANVDVKGMVFDADNDCVELR